MHHMMAFFLSFSLSFLAKNLKGKLWDSPRLFSQRLQKISTHIMIIRALEFRGFLHMLLTYEGNVKVFNNNFEIFLAMDPKNYKFFFIKSSIKKNKFLRPEKYLA